MHGASDQKPRRTECRMSPHVLGIHFRRRLVQTGATSWTTYNTDHHQLWTVASLSLASTTWAARFWARSEPGRTHVTSNPRLAGFRSNKPLDCPWPWTWLVWPVPDAHSTQPKTETETETVAATDEADDVVGSVNDIQKDLLPVREFRQIFGKPSDYLAGYILSECGRPGHHY